MDKVFHIFQFGDWRVEPHLNRICRGSEEKQLEPKAMDVLAYLLERNGEVVAARDMLDQLWPGLVVEEDAVYQRIAKIRRALGDDARNPKYIENIAKRGYRLIAAVESIGERGALDVNLLATLEELTPPFPAYEGDRPYVFVCYAHSDRSNIYPELVRLKEAGVNVWYDEGISVGSEWTEELGNAIEGCSRFLYYVSRASVSSRNCRDEVQFALK
ncbi:MAG: winged helix-turn-helix domain-containing protein, partial [Gammaproteobacteria bacterium]|nr:winged helix-turn-helix domain-containing protein [Gammaproteobacteria bacterium]